MMHKRLAVIALLLICSGTFAQDTTQKIIAGRTNSEKQQKKPYVILISADGFRYDFAKKYNATNLLRLSSGGVAAASMKPSFPSLTFPNHYSIVTGLYPSHHGLVDNSFYDGQRKQSYGMSDKKAVADSSWYGGTPLWTLAEQQQMLSASFYWVASESSIQGKRPTYYYIYNEKIKIDDRIAAVKQWLQLPEEKRPHLITFYLPEVDHEAHSHGPESKETEDAVHFVDESIGKLVTAVQSTGLPVDFIFVSDHGMTTVDTKEWITLPKAVDTTKFTIPWGDALVHLYAKDKKNIQPTYEQLKKEAKDFDVYLAAEMPERWHYSKKDDRYNRIGDIILIPHLPKAFNLRSKKVNPGKHGFDNDLPDMQATFYAWGPHFKSNYTIENFENVNIYPLIAEILQLKYKKKDIDGKLKVLKPVLK